MNSHRWLLVTVLVWPLVAGAEPPAGPGHNELSVAREGDTYSVRIVSDGEMVLSSPPEGLWSIARGWKDRWPTDWQSAGPAEIERTGEWTILKGELHAGDGVWRLRDAYRATGQAVECRRRFMWLGPGEASRCTLSTRFQARARQAQALLPGILYYGNPSGARSGRVPVFTGKPGEEALFEEHRFPMPFAYLEWAGKSGLRGGALHSVPSPAPFGNLKDQWWSLGVAVRDEETELQLLSGPCVSNGKRSVVKASQEGFLPYDNAFLNVPPGAVIEKTFFLEAFPVSDAGSGFRRPVRTSLEIFRPFSVEGLPTFAEITRDKYRFAKSRWHEEDGAAGFRKYPDRTVFVMGWCGQAASPGYALQVLADGLGDPAALPMAQKSLDFLSTAAFYDGGFRTWYDWKKRTWSEDEPLSQGQAMLSFANAIRVARNRAMNSAAWETFLRKACDLHSDRILAEGWRPRSTAEAFFIAPLCMAAKLFGVEKYRQAAIKAGRACATRHLSMREPYWGGTLDASCEDKEGAYAAFQGFLALYELTGDTQFLRWAEHACDVVLSYVYVWDIDLPPGRLRDHMLRTTGWTVVSPQNQLLDVYGSFIAPDIYRLGRLVGREDLQQLALVMFRTCGQLLDPYGSQGEQLQHTNYKHGPILAGDMPTFRGGYFEDWTVFWITAHFLNAAARFVEQGVRVWEATATASPSSLPAGGGLHVENGWFVHGDRVIWGYAQHNGWWRAGQRANLTRRAPDEVGPNRTEDLDKLTDNMLRYGYPGFEHNFGLWYDRRRDQHDTARRADGKVVAPFLEQPWARGETGAAWDGLPKYDLTRHNPWYFERLREFASLCDRKGTILFHNFYMQHALLETDAHYVDFPWRPANCVQDTGMPDRIPAANTFYDVTDPVRRDLHRAYIRKCLDELGDHTNVVHLLSEEYTGPASFARFWLDVIAEWQQEKGRKVLVGLGGSKDVLDELSGDPRVSVLDLRYWWYQPDGSLYAPKGGKQVPGRYVSGSASALTSPFCIYRQVREYRRRYPEKGLIHQINASRQQTWAFLMAGGSMLIRYLEYTGGRDPANYEVPADSVIIQPVYDFIRSRLARHLQRAVPQDLIRNRPESNWCLGITGELYLVYALDGGEIKLDLTGIAGPFRAQWLDPRTGGLLPASAQPVKGGTVAAFTAPTTEDWALILAAQP